MPRKPRIQYPGTIHHVVSRGGRQEPIYVDDVDRQDISEDSGRGVAEDDLAGAGLLADEQFSHLVVETPNASLVEEMRWRRGAYTIRLKPPA